MTIMAILGHINLIGRFLKVRTGIIIINIKLSLCPPAEEEDDAQGNWRSDPLALEFNQIRQVYGRIIGPSLIMSEVSVANFNHFGLINFSVNDFIALAHTRMILSTSEIWPFQGRSK